MPQRASLIGLEEKEISPSQFVEQEWCIEQKQQIVCGIYLQSAANEEAYEVDAASPLELFEEQAGN